MSVVPLRRVASILNGGTPTPDETNWGGDVPWATPVDLAKVNGGGISATDRRLTARGLATGSTLAPERSVLVSSRAPIGYTAIAQVPMAFNQGCKAVVPVDGMSQRFLQYALIAQTETMKAAGSGSTFLEISADSLASLQVPFREDQEQWRIADFLDDRVSRIDQIITARHDQIALITTQAGVAFERALAGYGIPPATSVETGWATLALPSGWRATTLGTVLRQLTNGYVGPTREILVDDGIRYVQSTHIKNGEIEFDRRPFFVTEGWHRERPRINLRVGDVLIVQTGAIGEAALVPAGFGEASCHALLIARVHQNLITPDYLIESLRSRFGHESMLARATGALHPHLEAGVKTTPLVLPPIKIQGSMVNLVGATRRQLLQIKGGLLDSIASLAEYKQSLITAAVTGELDVTTAGSGIPG